MVIKTKMHESSAKPTLGHKQQTRDHEAVEQRAHEVYEQRLKDNHPGDAQSDWLHAEGEVAARQH